MDRISELPEDTRKHILSFLTMRDAILTSVLSKTWRYDWLSIPCLNFGRDFFLQNWNLDDVSYQLACKDGPDPEDALEFVEFLDRAVISKRPTIQKLHLYIPLICSLHSRIASCLDRLIVDELVIDVIGDSIISKLSRSYYVPKCVLSCKSMTKLYIQGCNLSGISTSEINLPALRELSVNHVIMDQQMVENLVASCTGVEKLCLNDCEGFRSLKISGHPNLHYLEQKCNRGLELFEINTTNLHSICYSPHSSSRCALVLGSSCHTLTHIELSGFRIEDGLDFCFCRRLSDLRLLGCSFSNEWLNRHLSQFFYLDVLEIACDSKTVHLTITSVHLQCLKIWCERQLEQVQRNCPNLHDFIFCTHGNIISLSSETTLAPACVTLQLQINGSGDNTWDIKLIELLRQLRLSKYLSIETKIIELNYNEPTDLPQTSCGCYPSLPVNCWRHSL